MESLKVLLLLSYQGKNTYLVTENARKRKRDLYFTSALAVHALALSSSKLSLSARSVVNEVNLVAAT